MNFLEILPFRISDLDRKKLNSLCQNAEGKNPTQQLGKRVNRSRASDSLSVKEMLLLGSTFYQYQTAEAVACP